MGSTDSKQKLGERVIAARKKLDEDEKMQSYRYKQLELKSPATISVVMQSIADSFKQCSPFLEASLLIAWKANRDECREIILNSCRKVLSAPIIPSEYDWFQQYVFPSSIWMFEVKPNHFMFEELMDIAKRMSQDIIDSMDSIYNHLQSHPKWKELLQIENQTIVSRQDDEKVGLLKEKGIVDILEIKESCEDEDEDLKTFIDSNLAINILTITAKNINDEFQNHIQTVMSHYGDFKAGPMKNVERCLSKLENDYQDAVYPKASKLLDIVRCSVTFNTVEQLINGYKGFMSHIESNQSMIQLARVKNGFLAAKKRGGYRDIKINVIYHSGINIGVSMVCEVQLLLGQYLHEKKRIHNLYSIQRQKLYFQMTVNPNKHKVDQQVNVSDLKFVPVLNVAKDVDDDGVNSLEMNGKCSVDQDLNVLAIESFQELCCIDILNKKIIFTQKLKNSEYNLFSHSWIVLNDEKYLSVQTQPNMMKFFKVQNNFDFVEVKEFELCLDESDTITCCEFDRKFEHLIIVKNGHILEKRAVKKMNEVLVRIKLEEKIKATQMKILSLSNDGELCIVGGGFGIKYFYLIEIENKMQHKLISSNLEHTLSPCFINGECEYCVVGGVGGKLELWDIKKKISIKVIYINKDSKQTGEEYVSCMYSTNNILAVGSEDQMLRLWDVRNWEIFYSEQYEMELSSVHLTTDSKYLTIGGWEGEKSVVLGVQ